MTKNQEKQTQDNPQAEWKLHVELSSYYPSRHIFLFVYSSKSLFLLYYICRASSTISSDNALNLRGKKNQKSMHNVSVIAHNLFTMYIHAFRLHHYRHHYVHICNCIVSVWINVNLYILALMRLYRKKSSVLWKFAKSSSMLFCIWIRYTFGFCAHPFSF